MPAAAVPVPRAAPRRASSRAPRHGIGRSIPPRRKFADLIAAGAGVPGLGDQLDAAQQRVLVDGFQKTALVVEAIYLAG